MLVLMSALGVVGAAAFLWLARNGLRRMYGTCNRRRGELDESLMHIQDEEARQTEAQALKQLRAESKTQARELARIGLSQATLITKAQIDHMTEAYARARRVVEALEVNAERFVGDVSTLKTGIARDTVRGLEHYMCVDEDVVRKGMLEGTAAIVREIEQLGQPELVRALHEYGLCETGTVSLAALVEDERSVIAGLREHHIVAVRTYTSGAPDSLEPATLWVPTSQAICAACSPGSMMVSAALGFRHFNDPMRNLVSEKRRSVEPHPSYETPLIGPTSAVSS